MSTALVMLMTPALGFFYGGLVRRKNVLSTIMHSFFILALISVQWVLWGYSLAFGPGTAAHRRSGLARAARRRHGTRRRLRGHDPARALHGLPDDVRRHHPGPHHRRLRRAQALQGVRHLHPPLGYPRLRPGRPLGLGRSAAGCATCGALDFAGGTVVHITRRRGGAGRRRWCSASASASAERASEPHNLTYDGARRRAALVRLVRLQRRQRPGGQRPGGQRLGRHQHRRRHGRPRLDDRLAGSATGTPASLGLAAGAVAGLVAITPASGLSSMPPRAIIIGLGAGIFCFFAVDLLQANLGRRRRAGRLRRPRRGRHLGRAGDRPLRPTAINPAGPMASSTATRASS